MFFSIIKFSNLKYFNRCRKSKRKEQKNDSIQKIIFEEPLKGDVEETITQTQFIIPNIMNKSEKASSLQFTEKIIQKIRIIFF